MADYNLSYTLTADVGNYSKNMGVAAGDTEALTAKQGEASKSTKGLGEDAEKTGAKAKSMGEAAGTAGGQTKGLGTEAGKTGANAKDMGGKVEKAGKQAKQTGAQSKTAGESLQGMGKSMLAMSAAATAAIVGTAKLGMSYDREFSKITGLVGIAKEEVMAMKQETLGLAGRTAQAPQDLAKAMFTLQSAGLRGATATEALGVSAELAAGGMGEAGTIAQALTSVLDQYGASGVDAAKAADFLASTARAGNFESSQLAGGLGKVLPIAAQLGISIDDVGGSVALLTRANGNANISITQTAAAMKVLAAPSGEAVKILKDVGLTMGDVREVAAGPEGFVGALRLMQEAAGDTESFNKLLGSSEAILAANAILASSNETIAGTFGAVADGAGVAAEVFAAAAETDSFKYDAAMNDLKIAAIEFSTVTVPILTTVAEKVSGAVSAVVGFVSGMPEPLKKFLGGLLGITAAAGPVLLALGKVSTAFATMKAGQQIGPMASGFKTLAGGMAALGPAGLLVGVGLGAAAVAFMKWRKEAKEAKERATEYSEVLAEAQGLVTDFSGILDTNTDALDAQSEAFANVSPEGQAWIATMEGLGQLDLIDSLVGFGATLEDIMAVGDGSANAEQMERFVEALKSAHRAGIEINTLDLGRAMQKTAEAAEDGAAAANKLAFEYLNLGVEQGKWTGDQATAAIAAAKATGALNYQEVALSNMAKQYEYVASGAAEVDRENDALALTLGITADEMDNVTLSSAEVAEAEKALEEATMRAERAGNDLIDSLTVQTESFDGAREAGSRFKSMLDGMYGTQQDLDAAILKTIGEFADLNETFQVFNTEYDATNQEQTAFVSGSRDAATAIREQTLAMIANGASLEEVNAFERDRVAALQETLEQSGLTGEAIDELIATYGLVGDEFKTIFIAETEKAAADSAALLALVTQYGSTEVSALLDADNANAQRVIGISLLGVEEYDRLVAEAELTGDWSPLAIAIGEATAAMDAEALQEWLIYITASISNTNFDEVLRNEFSNETYPFNVFAIADAGSFGIVETALQEVSKPRKPPVKPEVNQTSYNAANSSILYLTRERGLSIDPFIHASAQADLQRQLDAWALGIGVVPTSTGGSNTNTGGVFGGTGSSGGQVAGNNWTSTGGVLNCPEGYYDAGGYCTTLYGGILHDGGIVTNSGAQSWPGLAQDEVPAVLQTGEFVLSRAMLAGLGEGSGGTGPSVALNIETGAVTIQGAGDSQETAMMIGRELERFEQKLVNTFRGTTTR